MWEGVAFEETIQNEIHALKSVAKVAEQEAEVAAKIVEAEKSARIAAELKAQDEAERNNKLTDYLLDNNRIEDLKRCTKDSKFKQQLMKELGI